MRRMRRFSAATAEPQTARGASRRASDGAWRVTAFSDVCGGIDEFQRALREEPQAADTEHGREALKTLVDDALYMLGRMEQRLSAYAAFWEGVADSQEAVRQIRHPNLTSAAEERRAISTVLRQARPISTEELIQRAEGIRLVAGEMEAVLRHHKQAVINVGKAYVQIRGQQSWDDGARETSLPPAVPEAWLPPSPHRERIVDWLHRGRAILRPAEATADEPAGSFGHEPLVEFEDGGVMPLRAVRWSDEVQNFYPLGSQSKRCPPADAHASSAGGSESRDVS
jgi:hypothetical protein